MNNSLLLTQSNLLSDRFLSNPAAQRIQGAWNDYSEFLSKNLDISFCQPKNDLASIKENILDNFLIDAYNSLTIEGYSITPEILEAIKTDTNYNNSKDCLAAKGYKMAFNVVLENIKNNFNNSNINYLSHANNIKENLFAAYVEEKIISLADIMGYRNHPVYIRGATHVPVSISSLGPCMQSLEACAQQNTHPIIKAILTHLFFVYIHPYSDGNGRTSRFLMNEILATNGYNWIIVPFNQKDEYFSALDTASAKDDILPFAKFITSLMSVELKRSLELKKNKPLSL